MAAAQTSQDDREAIRRLGKEWSNAVESRDLSRILSLVTDDVVFMPHGSASIVGKEALLQTYAGADLLTLLPLDGSIPIVIRARGVSIMKRDRNGAWKFARGISNMDQPPDAVGAQPG